MGSGDFVVISQNFTNTKRIKCRNDATTILFATIIFRI